MPPAPALEIRGLTVRYGDAVAVDDLDLTIPRGQTVALLGPNGAGKSTTVNAVLGLLNPAAGDVRVLDRSPRDAVRAGSVGAMLQHGGLPSETRVGEVLHLVRRSFGRAGGDGTWPLADLVATAGIDGLLDRPVDALSGGQRQRVLLALALVGAPPLLLLDEPTSAMDVEARRAFWTTMRGLAGRGHTVVFATHHLDEADAVADRVVVVAGGRVVADGTAAEIKAGAGGRTVSFTAAPGRRFDDVPGVTAVAWQGSTVRLATTDADATLRTLLADGGLPDLEVRGASLEDAVLSLLPARRQTTIGAIR
ncbi:ATP-binding cassette domain-containing protein [Blastococcus sp. BMG 814]|uniref:ATP-binding cassette domain-containing protein n=1 Tax=Blastococcus carthaginiensis TaxID=3050034 RepID=A0ABT9IDM0_9ACTN|nr:ATP-binding cassette domain-containing protein [Blastococcus carthaginiensis]MDP5183679.1 ATP-binding cassette domain-containing protein [Blastococcus carthaginiensis]